ncbi:MAG: CPBP family intramembrane metalloprotease [Deltaproteobacteria bacterium]|nr:CPBP family intramembrane metalloprotease [Deltaproteobacteria bacterium]
MTDESNDPRPEEDSREDPRLGDDGAEREDASGSADDEPAAPESSGSGEAIDPGYRTRAWGQALLVTAVSAAALTHAYRFESAGPSTMLPTLGVTNLVLFAGACGFARTQGELREQFAPRRLDLTMGAVVACVLYLAANLVPAALLEGRAQEGWLWRLYLQLGDASELAPPQVGAAIVAIAALEEIVWRGWVMRALRIAHGGRLALVASTLLYALAHLGTAFVLRDVEAGLNPLVVLAALGCGLVWGSLALRFDRVGPSLCAHAIFSWAVALFPMWRRG